MFLVHLGYFLAAFYSLLGLFILRLAFKPSCRICLLRDHCPNRRRGASQIAGVPRCAGQGAGGKGQGSGVRGQNG